MSIPAACMHTNQKRIVSLTGAMAVLFFMSIPLFSQSSQGTMQGRVFDQSGGAIAGATVTVTDVARGITRNLIVDEAGQYVAASLNPGTYAVRAEAPGFKTQERTGVLVEVGQTIRVDMVLQPGEQAAAFSSDQLIRTWIFRSRSSGR